MMKSVVVSVAMAWVAAPPTAPVQYQQSVVATLPNGYSYAVAPQIVMPAAQMPTAKRGPKLDALNVAAVFGLSAVLGYGASRAALATRGVKAPKGPLGGSGGPDDGWIGDQGRSEQVQKFEAATDYLFFQGPAPKTAVQDDLPSFFSLENFSDMEIKPLQIVFTFVGFGAAGALIFLLVTGS
jgi:hypothetical protein